MSVGIRYLDNGDQTWEETFVEAFCGINYLDYQSNKELLTKPILESNQRKIIKYLKRRDKLGIGMQILAVLILETGSKLPKKVKSEVLKSTTWEVDKIFGWDPAYVEDRKHFLNEFRQAILPLLRWAAGREGEIHEPCLPGCKRHIHQ